MNSKIQTLPPFTKFIATIGQLPSSYLVSMTYEEQLLWLCNYLENTVIPTLNNNGEAVEELQNLFTQLKSFVDDYFKNLDVQEEINNKLDDLAEDGTLTRLIGEYIQPIQNEFENEINEQFNQFKAQTNNEISNINTKVNNATSGSPLVASSISGMTDTARVYVNTTDGYWYYYNGSAWVQGGVYQSTINEETINIRKAYNNYTYETAGDSVRNQVKDLYDEIDLYGEKNIISANLFNKNDKNVVNGYAINSNGGLSVNNSYFTTGYIEIEPETQYRISSTGSKAFYDENFNFISFQDWNGGNPFTSPANTKYIRLSNLLNNFNTFMIVKGDTLPREYNPYKIQRTLTNTLINGNDIIKKSIGTDRLSNTEIIQSENLFNKNDENVLPGYGFDSSFHLYATENYTVSGYVEIEPETQYKTSVTGSKAFYDENFNFISGQGWNGGNPFTSPTSAKYMRMSVLSNKIDTFMIVKGDTLPSEYVEYFKGYKIKDLCVGEEQIYNLTKSVLKNKKIGFLGDSYTAGTYKYHQFIAERTGMIAYNYGESASRISGIGHYVSPDDTHDVDSFITRCENMDNDLDMVLVFGGINDSAVSSQELGTINDPEADGTTFYAGYKLLLHKLVTKYPTAIIGCVVPPQVRNYTRLHTTYKQAILDVCNMYGVPVLDLDSNFSYSNVNINLYTLPRYINNNQGTSENVNIHLNTAGQRKLSVPIQKFLESLFVK